MKNDKLLKLEVRLRYTISIIFFILYVLNIFLTSSSTKYNVFTSMIAVSFLLILGLLSLLKFFGSASNKLKRKIMTHVYIYVYTNILLMIIILYFDLPHLLGNIGTIFLVVLVYFIFISVLEKRLNINSKSKNIQ
ncbi:MULTISPECIES: hypothetical protein [Staphylococcus]|uniref:hypothetical protein n=1 Tax=Staphylococcus TaxID=1279 RepID=UPI000657B1E2|nr:MULTISPECIES: hypothetical protein [Staphylococcus]CRV19992.1 Uncharacterised protein [Streptococcus equi subsp. equi]MBN6755647.1 hypothetical protein [Staphylococcus saprophyticus]MBN6765625.1 hypothetical protein [Staphylococcus saprophyticus]MBN6770432.1 hypothetical protein [Staphylococcus saprophyticus]MBN6779095.1 hypothetical protein [Staphylococcus saprophyticus]